MRPNFYTPKLAQKTSNNPKRYLQSQDNWDSETVFASTSFSKFANETDSIVWQQIEIPDERMLFINRKKSYGNLSIRNKSTRTSLTQKSAN